MARTDFRPLGGTIFCDGAHMAPGICFDHRIAARQNAGCTPSFDAHYAALRPCAGCGCACCMGICEGCLACQSPEEFEAECAAARRAARAEAVAEDRRWPAFGQDWR